jgi:GAF domain-containing protein/anti-sigma regulatory factor (Ser/Thr protein kinase)
LKTITSKVLPPLAQNGGGDISKTTPYGNDRAEVRKTQKSSHISEALADSQAIEATLAAERQYFTSLLNLSTAIASSQSALQIGRELYRWLPNLVPAIDSFYLAMNDKKSRELRFVFVADNNKPVKIQQRVLHRRDAGLAGQVIERRKPVYISDLEARERKLQLKRFSSGVPTRTYLGLPLGSEDGLIGVISLQSYRVDAFDLRERRLLKSIATQTGSALKKVLQFEQTSARNQMLSKLYEVINAIRAVDGLDEKFNLIVETLRDIFELDTCTIAVLDSAGNEFKTAAATGAGARTTYLMKDFSRELAQLLVKSRRVVEIAELTKERTFPKALLRHNPKSMIVVPLRGKKRFNGIITLGSNGHFSLSPEKSRVLRALASQAATALENDQLSKQAQVWAAKLEDMGQMTLEMAKETKLDALLEKLTDMATELLASPGGAIYLESGKKNTLVLEAVKGLSLKLRKRDVTKDAGMVGRVLRFGRPMKVANYRHWRYRRKVLDHANLSGVLAAPIFAGEKMIGVIAVHSNEPGRVYNETEEKVLLHFARHAGAAIEAVGRAAEDQALEEMTQALTAKLRYPELLEKVTEILSDRLGYESFTLMTNEVDELQVAVEKVYPAKRIRRIRVGMGVTGWVAQHGTIRIVPNVNDEPDYIPGLGKGSEIAVPVIVEGRVIAVLDVESRNTSAFRDRDVRILTKIAAALAIAIVNAREMEKTEILKSLTSVISSSSDLVGILNRVAPMMFKACPATFCHIMLRTRDERENALRVRAACAMRDHKLDWNPKVGEKCDLLTNIALLKLIKKAKNIVFQRGKGRGSRFLKEFARHVELKGQLQSALMIPLRGNRGTLIGTCVLGEMRKWQRSSFNTANINFATTLAAQAGVAFEKTRYNELAAERNHAIGSLYAVGNAITGSLDLDEVLKRIVVAARSLLRAEVASIFLVQQPGFLTLQTSDGSAPEATSDPVVLKIMKNKGLTGHIASEGRLFNEVGPALTNHPAVLNRGRQRHLPSGFCTSLIALPLKQRYAGKSELIGLIKVENKVDKSGKVVRDRGFDKTDEVVLKTLASYAEASLENVRLYNVAHSAQAVARVVNSTLNHDEVLSLALRELEHRIEFDTASLQLLRGGELKIVACKGFNSVDKRKVMKLSFPLTDKFPNTKVIRNRHARVEADIRATRYSHFWDQAHVYCSGNIRGWMGVPLLIGQKIIGMLSIDSRVTSRYTIAHRILAESIAPQIAAAVVNAQLYKTSRSLLNILLDITEQLDLKTVLQKLAKAAVDKEGIIGADNAIVYLYDPDLDRIEGFPVSAGLPHAQRLGLNVQHRPQSAVYKLIRSARERVRNEAQTDPLLYRGFAKRTGVKSVAVYPLKLAGKPVGVMYFNYLTPHKFDDTEKDLMRSLTTRAALAIGHARNYQQVRDRFGILMNAAVSQFAASAWAHDVIKISSDIEGLADHWESSPNQHSRRNLKELSGYIEELNALEPPPVDLEKRSAVDVSSSVAAALKAEEKGLLKKSIRFKSQLSGLPKVWANDWLLQETIRNLVQNGVKWSQPGGTMRISGSVRDGRMQIRVIDRGAGIPQAVLRKLFKQRVSIGHGKERFRQRLGVGKRKGSGIGLLLSKQYMEACNGDLTLVKTGPTGTTFLVQLPLADGSQKRKRTAVT